MEETEKEFLKKYDASKYQKPSVAADIVIFSTCNMENVDSGELKLLLVKRGKHPYKMHLLFREVLSALMKQSRRPRRENCWKRQAWIANS